MWFKTIERLTHIILISNFISRTFQYHLEYRVSRWLRHIWSQNVRGKSKSWIARFLYYYPGGSIICIIWNLIQFFFFSFDGCESCTGEQLFLYASVIHLIRSRFEIQVSAQNEKGINLGNPFGNQIVENEAETRLTISDRKEK